MTKVALPKNCAHHRTRCTTASGTNIVQDRRSASKFRGTPRRGAKESSSSKKRMHGCALRACSNTSLTFFSLSPTYMLMSSGPLTLMKLMEDSVATALASSVLPVPGGP